LAPARKHDCVLSFFRLNLGLRVESCRISVGALGMDAITEHEAVQQYAEGNFNEKALPKYAPAGTEPRQAQSGELHAAKL
jgi:hypothetical protein